MLEKVMQKTWKIIQNGPQKGAKIRKTTENCGKKNQCEKMMEQKTVQPGPGSKAERLPAVPGSTNYQRRRKPPAQKQTNLVEARETLTRLGRLRARSRSKLPAARSRSGPLERQCKASENPHVVSAQ